MTLNLRFLAAFFKIKKYKAHNFIRRNSLIFPELKEQHPSNSSHTFKKASTVLDFPMVIITSLECICSSAWVAILSALKKREINHLHKSKQVLYLSFSYMAVFKGMGSS